MRTLHLQSKLMHGPDVKRAQILLHGANAFHKNFHPGHADGQYGPYTAAATHRAKHYLGYPKKLENSSFGPTLDAYLSGSAKLPRMYRLRSQRRIAKMQRRKVMRLAALDEMRQNLGLAENPQGSNHNWMVDWWYSRKGSAAAWCNISVSRAYIVAGSKAFKRGVNFAYVPSMEAATKDPKSGLMRIHTHDVRASDIITFEFSGDDTADHTGMAEGPMKSGNVPTIEGNTDSAGGAEGGQQLRKDRPESQIHMVIRVIF